MDFESYHCRRLILLTCIMRKWRCENSMLHDGHLKGLSWASPAWARFWWPLRIVLLEKLLPQLSHKWTFSALWCSWTWILHWKKYFLSLADHFSNLKLRLLASTPFWFQTSGHMPNNVGLHARYVYGSWDILGFQNASDMNHIRKVWCFCAKP